MPEDAVEVGLLPEFRLFKRWDSGASRRGVSRDPLDQALEPGQAANVTSACGGNGGLSFGPCKCGVDFPV